MNGTALAKPDSKRTLISMIFDTHTHSYFDELALRENEILSNMEKSRVAFAVQIGCNFESSTKAVALAKRHPDKYRATVGLHPGEAQKMSIQQIDAEIKKIRGLLKKERETIVAIGETGWDFYRLSEDSIIHKQEIESERHAFQAQVSLAREFDLPLVIHTRNSGQATLDSLHEFNIRNAVIHCFSEDLTFAQKAMEISSGIFFGFSGILTYKSAKNLHEAARELPLHRILVETDAPFLAPEPVRGTVNESANVAHVLERLKTYREEDGDTVEKTVFENSLRFYQISPSIFK